MAKSNRKCVICGNEYYYCTHGCTDSLNKPSWMASFCSDNCRNIYNAVARYKLKKTTAEATRKILDTCDLSSKESFGTSIKRLVEEVYEVTKTEEPSEIPFISGLSVLNTENVDKPSVGESLGVTTVATQKLDRPTNYKKKKRKRKND